MKVLQGSDRGCWKRGGVFGVLALILSVAAGAGQLPAGRGVPAEGVSASADVPADWWSGVQKDLAEQEYRVTWQEKTCLAGLESAWQAPNRAHDLRTYFTSEGPRVVRRTESEPTWIWGLELVGLGNTGVPPVAETVTNGNRIEYRRGELIEWYVNDRRGLEQGFTIESPFQFTIQNSEFVVDLAVRGDLVPGMMPDGETIEFLSDGGVGVIHYGELRAWDANGKELPARMELVECGGLPPLSQAQARLRNPSLVRLVVDGRDAAYPVSIDPLATSAAWTAESNQAGAIFGLVATAGDVNGDGYSDVVVGAPSYDNGQTDEGRAFVYHGSASGLSSSANWTAEGDQEGAEFGGSVSAAGDVNGDGFSDVIVGANYYDNGQEDEGRAFVYHGSASGLSQTPAWTAESDQEFAEFGWSVSTAGDVNGDGYADVIVAADIYTNDQSGEGRAFVYHGSASGLSVSASWTAEGNQAGAWFGNSVSTAGDVNGDGYSDVIVGAPDYTNGQMSEGRAFVYHGSSSGLSSSAAWTAESNQAEAWFGYSVATAGDVNGDGYADVVVGAPYASNGQSEEGRAFVYYGSGSGLAGTATWTAESDRAGAYFGGSVATAGDVNGDGYAEVAVGAPLYINGEPNEGGAFLWYGSASGLGANGTPTNADWAAESDQAEAYFGLVATAGDVNGDGYSDVIVGAGGYDNDQTDEGRAFVYHGAASGLGTAYAWTATSGGDMDSFGWSVATAGDVNGDGYADVIVGAFWYDNGQFHEGGAFVYHGSASGLSSVADWIGECNQSRAEYGFRVSGAGDVNGDGYADVIVGAWKYDSGETDEGRVFVYHGSYSGLSTSAAWTAEGSQQNTSSFGGWVAAAGDVNGDGYADVVISAPYDRAFVYHGSPSGLEATAAWNTQPASSVATAGDVNGDGYADVIVGMSLYGDSNEGGAFVYHGSAAGLLATPSWTAEGNQEDAWFGNSVATAGDVNGDGYSDVIVGAYNYDTVIENEGRAFVYHGSASGLSTSADWTAEGDQWTAGFGSSVCTAGDVNGDGYSDVIVGAASYDSGQNDEGRAYVYHGSAAGLSVSPDWIAESNQAGALFGGSVSTAGDVNGDGFCDVIVGSYGYDTGATNAGRAFVYYGNGETGGGLGLHAVSQWQMPGYVLVAPMGLASTSEITILMGGRSPFGRGKITLEVECKPLGTHFDGTGTTTFPGWVNTGVSGSGIGHNVSGLTPDTVYHWRARVLYHPATTPYQQHSRWIAPWWNGAEEGDFRTKSLVPEMDWKALFEFARHWCEEGYSGWCDFNGGGTVDGADLLELSRRWHE